MIGDEYRAMFAQAVFGDSRSPLAPATLWLSWLSPTGAELSSGRVRVPNTSATWGATDAGVANVTLIDGGAAGDWTIGAVGLYDSEAGGNLVLSVPLQSPVTTTEGDFLTIPIGALTVEVSA